MRIYKADKIMVSTKTIYQSRPKAESTLFSLTCSTVHLLYFLALGAAKPISTIPLGESSVIYAKSITKYYEILQNNPKIYSQKVYISHHFFHFFLSFPFFFYYFYALFCTFCPFFQLLDINTLNSIYNNDLHNFFTPKHQSPLTKCEIQKNTKRTQFAECPNEPKCSCFNFSPLANSTK